MKQIIKQKAKQLLALSLALALCLGLASPALAAEAEESAAQSVSTASDLSSAPADETPPQESASDAEQSAAAASASSETAPADSSPSGDTEEKDSPAQPETDPADGPAPAGDSSNDSSPIPERDPADRTGAADTDGSASALGEESLLAQAEEDTLVIEVALDSSDSGAKNASALLRALANANSETPLVVRISEKGTYSISKRIDIRSNTTLDLNGSTLVRSGSIGNLVNNADLNGDRSGGGYALSYDITVKNGTLNGSGGRTAMANLVNIGHATNVTFENVNFRNGRGSHLLEMCGCKNSTVKNCTFSGYTATESDAVPGEAIQLDIASNAWNGVFKMDGTVCKNITVTGCSFKDYPSGVGNHHTIKGNHSSNITITNNTFSNSKTYRSTSGKAFTSPAISCCGFDNSTVSGNKITGKYSYGVKYSSGSTKITKNTFGSAQSPLSYPSIHVTYTNSRKAVGSSSTVREYVTGGVIDSNRIYSRASGNAFRIYSGKLSSVSGNQISSSKACCLYMSSCTISSVDNNKLVSKDREALYLTGCKVKTIRSNTASSSGSCGISLNRSTKVSSALSGNQVSSCKSSGIYLNSSSVSALSSNQVSSCKKHGIHLGSKASVTKIYANTVKSCSGSGLYVTSTGTVRTVQKNTITGCKKYGIQVANSKLKKTTITKNTLKKNKKAITVKSKNKKNGNVFQTK